MIVSLEEWGRIVAGPHARLAVWLPLAGYLAWRRLERVAPLASHRARVVGLFALAMLPGLVFVPPVLRVLLADPALAPAMAGRLSTAPPAVAFSASPLWALTVVWPFLLIPVSALVAAGLGVVEQAAARLHVALLPKRYETCRGRRIVILGAGAAPAAGFTLGLLRPRIYLSEEVWNGPCREAVVAHEAAHAAGRDPLLVFAGRWLARTFWYLPHMRRLWRDFHGALEMAADRAAVRRVGTVRYARALTQLAVTPPRRPVAALGFDGLSVLAASTLLVVAQGAVQRRMTRPAPAAELLSRLTALERPRGPVAVPVRFWLGFGLMYAGLLLAT